MNKIKRIFIAVGLACALVLTPMPVSAQVSQKTLTTATTCPGVGCFVIDVSGRGSVGIQVTGTFSGTLQFEQTIDGTNYTTWPVTLIGAVSTVTSTTGTGVWTGPVTTRYVRVRFSAYVSGSAVVSLVSTQARAGGGSGGGFTPSGAATDFMFGDGTSGRTFATGTRTTNSPLLFTQTHNASNVIFHDFVINTTVTAEQNQSCAFEVQRAGVNQFSLCNLGASVYTPVSASAYGVGTGTGQISYGLFSSNQFKLATASNWSVMINGSSATCVSGCGTSPTITGTATGGSLVVGTSPNATTIVLGGEAWPTAPNCLAVDNTTGSVIKTSNSTSQFTLTGVFTAADVLVWHCVGAW